MEYRKTNPAEGNHKLQKIIFDKIKEIFGDETPIENEVTIDYYDLLYADLVDKERKLIIDVRGN